MAAGDCGRMGRPAGRCARDMPCTRAANSALDKVAPQFDEVVGLLAAYGDTDLLCYRATPAELIARQAAAWDPLLGWAARDLDAPLDGDRRHRPYCAAARQPCPLRSAVRAFTPFQLAAVHDLIAISGSLILAFAVTRGRHRRTRPGPSAESMRPGRPNFGASTMKPPLWRRSKAPFSARPADFCAIARVEQSFGAVCANRQGFAHFALPSH